MLLKLLKQNQCLFVILLGACLIRLWGVYPGLQTNHPDEPFGYAVAINMFYHNLKPNTFDYPPARPLFTLIFYYLFILPAAVIKNYYLNPSRLLLLVESGNLTTAKNFIFGPNGLYLLYTSRLLTGIVGSLTVLFAYKIGQKMFNRQTGLITAFLLAFNYRHVLMSHLDLPDIYNGFFLTVSFYFNLRLLRKNSFNNYLLSFVAAALAFSIKYQVFAFVLLIVTHLIWVYRMKSIKYLFSRRLVISGLISLAVIFILNPYLPFNLPQFFRESRYNYLRYQMGVMYLRAYPYFYLYHWGLGRMITALAVIGAIIMAVKSRSSLLLLLVSIIPFMAIMTYYSNGGVYPRNFVTVTGLILVFAGYALNYLTLSLLNLFPKYLKKHFVLLVLMVAVAVNSANIRNSLSLSRNLAKSWNSQVFDNWLLTKLPANQTVRTYENFASPKGNKALAAKHTKVLAWDYLKGPNSLAEFQAEGTDLAIMNTHKLQNVTYWWRGWDWRTLFAYSAVPFDFIENSFYGLTVRELSNYAVAEIYKPWQVLNENNYLIYNIPKLPESKGRQIKEFDFRNSLQGWQPVDPFSLGKVHLDWSKTAASGSAALIFKGKGGSDTSRLVSPLIDITPGKYYSVTADMRNYPKDPALDIDAFLRLDFYPDKESALIGKDSLTVALSTRAPVNGEWTRVRAGGLAPKQAKYLTVSLQRRFPYYSFDTSLANVGIYESSFRPPANTALPYIKLTIPKTSIYTNSFL